MEFKAKLRKIGNSVGVIIPLNVITSYNLGDVITLNVITDEVITPNVITSETKELPQEELATPPVKFQTYFKKTKKG